MGAKLLCLKFTPKSIDENLKPPNSTVLFSRISVFNPFKTYIYHLGSEVSEIVENDEGIKQLLLDPSCALVGNKMFISGGKDSELNISGMTLEFNYNEKLWMTKEDMIQPRIKHSLLPLSIKTLYAIGGWYEELMNKWALKECEKYDIDNDKWQKVPSLNSPKLKTCAFQVDKKMIYIFGGTEYPKQEQKSEFEVLDTEDEEEGWKVIPLKLNESLGSRCYCAIQIYESVLIFGGNNVFLYYYKEGRLKDYDTKNSELIANTSFAGRHPIIYKDNYIAVVDDANDIYFYSLLEEKWEKIPFIDWTQGQPCQW